MPRIPDASSLGYSVPQTRTPRFQDRSEQIVGAATDRLAGTIGQVAGALQEREDKFSYAQAKSTLLQADIEARRELENDGDWATYETRYAEKMSKAREKAAGFIRSKNDRALFDMDAKLDVERGVGEIRGLSKRKEIDWGRASLDSILESNRTAALNAKDEQTRAALIAATQEMIGGAKAKGYVSEQEAVNHQQAWTADYAEGFVGMQPLEERIKLLGDGRKSVADYIAPDRRVDLLRRAEDELRIQRDREAARAKQAQAESRQALGERVRDARASYRLGLEFDTPPTRSDFIAAFGADGAKEYESFEKDRRLGADLSRLATMSESEQAKLLQESAPKGTEGAAEQSERYHALVTQAERLRTQRDADPAMFVARHSPRVQAAWSEAQDSPEAASAYATATVAEQKRLGVSQPKILPAEAASEIAQSFYTEKGEQVAALIQTEREKWGQHWPQVFGELAAKKMPPAALAIGRGMEPGAATRLASVSAIPMKELQNGVDVPAADIRTEIDSAMTPFLRTLDGVVGAENTYAGMRDATERLTYAYLRQGGKSTAEAVEQAYSEVLGDHYAFREVNGRSFRVPVEHDVSGLEIGAHRALNTVPIEQLQLPVPTSTGTQEAAASDLKRAIQRRGYWVTSANGENGLALFLDGAPVLRKDGSVYELRWDDLTRDITATRSAVREQDDERLFREAQGLR